MKPSIRNIRLVASCLILCLALLVPSLCLLSCNPEEAPPPPYEVKICEANKSKTMLYNFPTADEFSPLQPDGTYPERVQSVDGEAPKTHTVWLGREWCGEYVSTERFGALVADSYRAYTDGNSMADFTVERGTGRVIGARFDPPTLQTLVKTEEVAACAALDLLRATCGETFSLEFASTRTLGKARNTAVFRLPVEGGEIVLAEFAFDFGETRYSVSPFAAEMIRLLPEKEALRTSVQAKLEEVYKGGLQKGSFSIKDFTLSMRDWCMTEEGAKLLMDVDVTLVTTPGGAVYPSPKGYKEMYSSFSEDIVLDVMPTQAEWDSASEKTEKLTVCITVGKDRQREIEQPRALIRPLKYACYFLYDFWPAGWDYKLPIWRRQLPDEYPHLQDFGTSGGYLEESLPGPIVRENTVLGETIQGKATDALRYPGVERQLRFGAVSVGEAPKAFVYIGEDSGRLFKFRRPYYVNEEGDFRPEDAVKAAEELWSYGAVRWEVTENEFTYELTAYHPTNPVLMLGRANFSKSGVLNAFERNAYADQALTTAAPGAEELQEAIEERIAEYYRPYYDAGIASPDPTVTFVYDNLGTDYIRILEDGRLGILVKATIEHLTSEGIVEKDIMHFCIPFYS